MIQDNPSVIEPTLKELKTNFLTHLTKDVAFRKQQLQSLLRGLTEMKDEFIQACFDDLGYKDKFTALQSQIDVTFAFLNEDIKYLDSWAKRRNVDTNIMCSPGKSYIQPEPYGVVLVIGAWNYPLTTSIHPVISAIAAGNCIVLKPSELAPKNSNAIAKLFANYLDPRFYRVIEGGIEVAKTITTKPFDLIIFTGGTEKGKLVAKAAAENLVPCILELGGKSPCIVDGTVDLQVTCKRLASMKHFNLGQTCISPDYVLLKENLKDQFLNQLKQTLTDLYGENPSESRALSRMINEFHTERVLGYLKDCKGEVFLGGKGDVSQKWIEPTVVVNPSVNSKLMQDEIFGPVLPIITYKTDDECVKFINDRHKPLALYYFGSQGQFKERLIKETSAGGMCFNDCLFHFFNSELPFGGVGYSGYGSLHGKNGFDQCSHLKPVLDKSISDPLDARYPPYTEGKVKIMNFTAKYATVKIGDLQRIGGLVGVLLFLVVAWRFNFFGCCSGNKDHHHQHKLGSDL